MTKKQILATCLAGSLALGCISGCANKKTETPTSEQEISLNQDNKIREGYIISITSATIKKDENGTICYVAPNGWILFDNLCYQVSYRKVVSATPVYENGQIIAYSVPEGYVLSGTKGYMNTVVTDTNLKEEIVYEYLGLQKSNKLTLK